MVFWIVTWSQLCSKSLLNKYEALSQQHFERYPQFFILRTWINMRVKSFIKTLVNVTETRIDEGAWKKIVAQSEHLEEHFTKIETTFHLFYALLFLTNLGIFFDNVNHNLLFCLLINIWYITDLEVYLVLLRFFIRNSNNLMRLGVLFLKVFSFKNLSLCSYFFIKNAYLVTAKITLDVSDCLYAA